MTSHNRLEVSIIIIFSVPCVRNGLTTLTIQQAWLNLDVIIYIGLFQDIVLSVVIPRKFKVEVFNIILLLYLIYIMLWLLCLVINGMKWVLPRFWESKLEENLLFVFLKIIWITFSKSVKLGLLTFTLLSSTMVFFYDYHSNLY